MSYNEKPGHNSDVPWRRSSRLELYMRPGERADLDSIAEHWGVPSAAVGWVIIAGYLAKHRARKLSELPHATGQQSVSTTHAAIMAYEAAEEAENEEQKSGDSQETGADAAADRGDRGDRDQLPDPD